MPKIKQVKSHTICARGEASEGSIYVLIHHFRLELDSRICANGDRLEAVK